MKNERRYTMDNGDGFILSAADWAMDFSDRRPRVVIGISIAVLALSLYGIKVESEKREKECLPPSSCHERIWKDANPGEQYPYKRLDFSGFKL